MSEYTGIRDVAEFLLETVLSYQGRTWFLAAALAGIIFLSVMRGRRARTAFLYPLLFLAVSVFNPVLLFPIFVSHPEFGSQYYNFFWILPVPFLIAGAAAWALDHLGNGVLRAVLAAAACVLVLGAGYQGWMNPDGPLFPRNPDKTEAEAEMVGSVITAQSRSDFPKAAFEDELAPKVRRSHPFVLASFSGIPADQEDVLLAEIEATDTEFLVAVTGSGTDLAIRELGFPLLAETASHSVFSTMY